ncbi:MAG: hypothetical protein LBE91_06420 [Tannerella sp.]|jgi:hypothetical protein|nr:hypothetical protein [Tannerella sp.]
MKKYYLRDGGVIQAESPRQFVTELRLGSFFDSDCTDEEYMHHVAGRYKIYSSTAVIDIASPEAFLASLIAAGYVERME